MSLKYILDKVAAENGINNADVTQRAWLVDKINQAAREIYRYQDIPISLKECFIRTSSNKELALPPFVGELRAIRSGCKDFCTPHWTLQNLYPRYNRTEWESLWKNWRVKSYVPVAIDWLNTAPGTITYPAVDPTVSISIVGETDNSSRAVETISLDAISKVWTKTFLSINKITKNKPTDYNVVISDADGNEAAIIYADQLESRYLLVDVSEYPTTNCCDCGDGTYIMEILYKPVLPVMLNDNDYFPVDGYDDVVALKTQQLITEKEEGKEQRALMMHEKAKLLIKDLTDDKQGTVVRKLNFKRNPIFSMSQYYRDVTNRNR